MKKIAVLFILLFCNVALAQTILASTNITLKKPASSQQFISFTNKNNTQIVTVAADKETILASRYNSAVFFTDSLLINRPEKKFEFITGYSFNESQNPTLYYSTEDYKSIQGITVDFANKTTTNTFFTLATIDKEIFVSSFTENNIFYILTAIESQSELKLYVFQNDLLSVRTLNLGNFEWLYDNKKTTLGDIIAINPIVKVDNDLPNTIFTAVAKSKLYVVDNQILLTFDHSPGQTQSYSIDLSTYEIKENKIQQPTLQKTGVSNSFYIDKKLFQLKLNDHEMVFTVKDFPSGTLVKTFTAAEKDTITFKNSPLFSQRGNQKSVILKNTQKFLDKASRSDVGLAVYKQKKHYLVTVGGTMFVASTGGLLLGIAGIIAEGDASALDYDQVVQTVFFDSVFDTNFNSKQLSQLPLAADGIYSFLEFTKDAKGTTVFKFKDYYILSYYDPKTKLFIMRKFQDGIWY